MSCLWGLVWDRNLVWEQCWLLSNIHWLLSVQRCWSCRWLLREEASQLMEGIFGLLQDRLGSGLWCCVESKKCFQLMK